MVVPLFASLERPFFSIPLSSPRRCSCRWRPLSLTCLSNPPNTAAVPFPPPKPSHELVQRVTLQKQLARRLVGERDIRYLEELFSFIRECLDGHQTADRGKVGEPDIGGIVWGFDILLAAAGPRPRRTVADGGLYGLWHRAVRVCFERREIGKGLRVVYVGEEVLEADRLKLTSYLPCVVALVKARKWRSLEYVVSRMWGWEHSRPDEKLVAMMANGCVEAGRLDIAVRFIRNMQSKGVSAEAHCYSVLLKGYGRLRRGAMVERTVETMRRKGIMWDTAVLNAAVDAFVRCGMLDKAEQILTYDDVDIASLANVRTYNTLIKGYGQRKHVIKAFSVATSMDTQNILPDEVTMNSLVDACVRVRDYERAWEILDSCTLPLRRVSNDPLIKELSRATKGESIKLDQLVISLTTILSGVAEDGKINEAVGMLSEMERRGAKPNYVTYTALISACLRQGLVYKALHIFNGMRSLRIGPKAHSTTYNAMIAGLAQTGQRKNIERAAYLLNEMHRRKGISASEPSVNAVMDGWVRIGQVSEAEKLIRTLKKHGIRASPVPYTTLIKGFSRQGNFEKARHWFCEMGRQGIKPDRVSLNSFLTACCRAGKVDLARKMLNNMERAGGDISPDRYSYAALIAERCRARDLVGATVLYEKMRKNGVRANRYIVEMMWTSINALTPLFISSGPRETTESALADMVIPVLRDSFTSGVEITTLTRWRQNLINMLTITALKARLEAVQDPAMRVRGKISQEIFWRHGWNDIESGWRVL